MQPRQNRARLRPRARGFDRGIEREKVCLSGDIPDQVDDFSDQLNRIGEPAMCSFVVCASTTECDATSAARLI